MEPLDPARNDEKGVSKRRISSILKAPRKSIQFPDPKQQENVVNDVECTKPVEKRNSRRVSFAPANDVLLFSKEEKNAAPARSPLQELMTTSVVVNPQNRAQVTDAGIQQIMGMETLLNAPLHASQQKDKVNIDTGNDFGEKTVMFSVDDAFMDMTHSHTINIANDEDLPAYLPQPNRAILPKSGEKTMMCTADDVSMDITNMSSGSLSMSRKTCFNVSSSAPCFDPGFTSFLASLSKPSGASINPTITRMTPNAAAFPEASVETKSSQIKTHRCDVDKENCASEMENLLNKSKNVGDSSCRGGLGPEDDANMDMTEAHTGHIMGFDDDDDDPFQCLFPTKELYSHSAGASQTAVQTSLQQSSKIPGSSNPKAVASGKRVQKVITEEGSRQISDMKPLKNPSSCASHQTHEADFNTKGECFEKTVRFTADDACMDMTKSHTVNIASGPFAATNQYSDIFCSGGKTDFFALSLEERRVETRGPSSSSAISLDQGFKSFLAGLSKPNGPSMNPAIAKMVPTAPLHTKGSLAQIKTPGPDGNTISSLNTTRGISSPSTGDPVCAQDDFSMDMTEAHTGSIIGIATTDNPLWSLFPTQDMFPKSGHLKKAETMLGDQSRKEPVSSNNTGMEMSVKVSSKTKVQRHQVNSDVKEESMEKKLRLNADGASMDVTQSHTVNIFSDLDLQSNQNHTFLPTSQETTARFTENDITMDMTQCLTVNIDSNSLSDSIVPFKKQEVETRGLTQRRCSSAHSVEPGLKNLLKDGFPDNPVTTGISPTAAPSIIVPPLDEPEDDVSMDMTEAQTGHIFGITGTDDPLQCHFPKQDMYPPSGNERMPEMTSKHQSSEEVASSNLKGLQISQKMQSQEVKFGTQDDCREKTVRFFAEDACMDVTQSRTVNIIEDFELQSRQHLDFVHPGGEKTVRFTANEAAMDETQSHTVNIATHFGGLAHQNVDFLPASGEKTVKFTADDAAMDMTRSHTVNIGTHLANQHTDLLPVRGEKTVRFTANEAAMDETQSHTVNIATHFGGLAHQNVDFLPASGEKTVKFTADDAAMDVTRSHTVNISTHLANQHLDLLPVRGEKTVRFTANEAAMDVTQSHTVNIAAHLEPQAHHHLNISPNGEDKTVRFMANDAGMDVTQSHTVNIATNLEPPAHQQVDFVPARGEKTFRFTSCDATMDMTHCLTVNIAANLLSESVIPVRAQDHETCDLQSVQSLGPRFKNSASTQSAPSANLMITKAVASSVEETVAKTGSMAQPKARTTGVDYNEGALGVTDIIEKSAKAPTKNEGSSNGNSIPSEDDVNIEMTEAHIGFILEETRSNVTSQQSNEVLGSSSFDDEGIKNVPNSLDSNKTETQKDHENQNQIELRNESSPLSSSDVDQDVDSIPSRKSRRKSLADLQSKIRRLSHLVNTAPDTNAMDSCTAPLPLLDHDLDKKPEDKTKSLLRAEPELETGFANTEDDPQTQYLSQGEPPTTPFNLKTKELMSRLSMGSFKPKLPQKNKSDNPEKTDLRHVTPLGKDMRTSANEDNVANQLNNADNDVSDIYDEELGSCEELSETLDSLQKISEKGNSFLGFHMEEVLEDDVFEEDFVNSSHGKKRHLPEENKMEDEKRMKGSSEATSDVDEMGLPSHLSECDGNITAAPNTTQTADTSSSTHTVSSRCEATFESTSKQSLFESQLEDYTSDVQKKLEDGTITMMSFFKLFNIDFVIHNPRQSVIPGRLVSDADRTPMDLWKEKHIIRPKQMVYEMDVLNLKEKVEGLKIRMQDLDKPLKIINRPLWKEMRQSSEKELKSFGAKLKERNNFFRKMSKTQSHEMKEVLYSNLGKVNMEEQQKLRRTIEEVDDMIKSLDNCICELETELAAVEKIGVDNKLSLNSLQEGLKKVTETMADNEREIYELEIQKKQNSNKVNKLKTETRNLERHINMLNLVNEWRFREKSDNCTIYTFLNDTLHLQLEHEHNGNDAAHEPEQKISHIIFTFQLDDEKSQCHARLVHKLLSQYINTETSWVERYPTSRHVPKLLHDVSLVVSRCRLLGEELRLLKMWGGLRLDIMDMSCVDTQVQILFSSLRKLSKFEVILSVSLVDHVCVLQVQSFKNIIGNVTIKQIQDIVASFIPAKKLLTKIVRKIYDDLLC